MFIAWTPEQIEERTQLLLSENGDGSVDIDVVDEGGNLLAMVLTITEDGVIKLHKDVDLEQHGFTVDEDGYVEVIS